MSSIEFLSEDMKEIMSASRATITAPFFGNNVKEIKSVAQAYKLAKKSAGTVELKGRKIYKATKLGLPFGANQLLFNDGAIVGRCTAARKIVGTEGCDEAKLLPVIREAIYNSRYKTMYKANVIIGLDEDFMVKAHLLIPKNHENIMLSWLLNFQAENREFLKKYKKSMPIPRGDIYIYSNPDWQHPDFPYGLTYFDPKHNCAAILGMKYFGEHKKGTLTLAWGTAAASGYAACHGGMKRYNLPNNKSYQVAVFGLSGSGKSTITHAKHNNKYDITVLHDDAFIINVKDKYSIALEPAYFDKTADYPINCEDNKYILTLQNNGVIQAKDGTLHAITEDVRNGNGRAVKSRFWSKNRVDRINQPINAIFWLMKDPTIPPVLKLSGASLGSAMGATLATKRTSAERLAEGVDPNALVVEPYANPFRVYPLERDYTRFKQLMLDGVECYILNTGEFMGKKVTPQVTLGIIEAIVEGKSDFHKWENFSDIEIMDIEGYELTFENADYKEQFKKRMQDRIDFVKSRDVFNNGIDKLPNDALIALEEVLKQI